MPLFEGHVLSYLEVCDFTRRVFVWLGNDGIFLALLLINDSAFVLSKVGWLREGFFLFFPISLFVLRSPYFPGIRPGI